MREPSQDYVQVVEYLSTHMQDTTMEELVHCMAIIEKEAVDAYKELGEEYTNKLIDIAWSAENRMDQLLTMEMEQDKLDTLSDE